MSKSLGNVVDPFNLLNKYGVNAVRLYFLTNGPLQFDCEIEEDKIENYYYKIVADGISNLLVIKLI